MAVRVQRVAAYGVVHDSAGRVLLARLTDRTAHPGRWTLPGGDLARWVAPEEVATLPLVDLANLGIDMASR
jgi:hypothetical protein